MGADGAGGDLHQRGAGGDLYGPAGVLRRAAGVGGDPGTADPRGGIRVSAEPDRAVRRHAARAAAGGEDEVEGAGRAECEPGGGRGHGGDRGGADLIRVFLDAAAAAV